MAQSLHCALYQRDPLVKDHKSGCPVKGKTIVLELEEAEEELLLLSMCVHCKYTHAVAFIFSNTERCSNK